MLTEENVDKHNIEWGFGGEVVRLLTIHFSVVHPTMLLEPSPHMKRVCQRSAKCRGFLRLLWFHATGKVGQQGGLGDTGPQ